MGTVYVAEHVGLGQPRAIKFLRADLARKPGAVQRFLQEARVLSAMRHDNLVGVIDMGEYAGSAYYVMELLAGEDLRQRLRRLGGLGWPQTRAIALQVCAALRLTHARGVVHRDLKPENCFCVDAADGALHIKLLDFGIAKVPREAGGASQLTGAGEMLGTVGYMAPEQLEGQGDRRADVYSLGAMMFEMLAGRPLHAGNAFEILSRMLLAPAPRLGSVCAVDPAIDRLLATAVARDPDERFGSVDAFAAAIAEIPVTAEPQAFDRLASALARPEGETTAGGAPVLADMPVTAIPGPEDMLLSLSLRRTEYAGGVHASGDGAAVTDAPADIHGTGKHVLKDMSSVARAPVPTDISFVTHEPVPAEVSSVTVAHVPMDRSSVTSSPVPADMSPVTSSPVPADMSPVTSSPVPADMSPVTSSPVPADMSSVTPSPVSADISAATPPPVPVDSSAAPPTPVPADRASATSGAPVLAGGPPAPRPLEPPVPAGSPAAPSRSRVAGGLAVALFAAGIAWQVWPVGEVSTALAPATSTPGAATASAPAASPFAGVPVPATSPDLVSFEPVPSDILDDSPVKPVLATVPELAPGEPVPAASPEAAPAASRPAPARSARDASKPAASVRPLTRAALRGRLERELATCGSPYVAEEIAVRVTPGEAGKLLGLAAIADDRLAPGTVDCLGRELARVLAGLAEGVDAARAFDVSLTLPRRGGG
ncbi:protein kinase domain-containing protein [Nannocystis bainbridge]|uniref:Protein kinase n=1 Tax=Nannocystis bainbridge TaxID=2995303 RepID=A0ABT5E5R9_9BACT|nr:protein kinase [Nannocystis bainbridge]MDC0721191.1 protein kinase [Nannocystis bainbridge]